jgi:O-antigen/teichoic acid export membrane protein
LSGKRELVGHVYPEAPIAGKTRAPRQHRLRSLARQYLRGNVTLLTSSRARRIFGGWSANVVQVLLSLTQQIVLIPLFLKFWTGETLSAWLTIFAAGSLVLAADGGLHAWSLNRFLSFKSRTDCDRRTGRYYGAVFQLFVWFTALFAIVLLAVFGLAAPSKVLGFSAEPGFDVAFTIMVLGSVLTLPVNLASSLYRARGLYGRIVRVQALGTAVGQLGQIVGVVATGSLLAVVIAYVAGQIVTSIYILLVDARRQFPLIANARRRISWRWTVGQFVGAFPFAVMNFAEVGLTYISVLLIGVFVSDRIAIAQWGLTRTIAGLLRGLGVQMTLPLAAELGHDHAIGARDSLQRLYARGSIILVSFVSLTTSGALVFWPDFFEIWTRGAVPFDATLAITLLLGMCIGAPAILALSYANYSNRGPLLLWTKSLQLAIFLVLSIILIPRLGPLGAAIALVSSDIIAQFGVLFVIVVGETLKHPLRHTLFLIATMVIIVSAGAAVGTAIRYLLPGTGIVHFLSECTLWLVAVALLSCPLASKSLRHKLVEAIPR